MLNKEGIMLLIIWYIEMRILYGFSISIDHVSNVHKNNNLSWAPIHALYLVLNLKSIVLSIINMRQNHALTQALRWPLAMVILPPCNEVMPDKLEQFGLQVFKKYYSKGLLICLYNPLPWLSLRSESNNFIFKTLPCNKRCCWRFLGANWQLWNTTVYACTHDTWQCMPLSILRFGANDFPPKRCCSNICLQMGLTVCLFYLGMTNFTFTPAIIKEVDSFSFISNFVAPFSEHVNLDVVATATYVPLIASSNKIWLQFFKGPHLDCNIRMRFHKSVVKCSLQRSVETIRRYYNE